MMLTLTSSHPTNPISASTTFKWLKTSTCSESLCRLRKYWEPCSWIFRVCPQRTAGLIPSGQEGTLKTLLHAPLVHLLSLYLHHIHPQALVPSLTPEESRFLWRTGRDTRAAWYMSEEWQADWAAWWRERRELQGPLQTLQTGESFFQETGCPLQAWDGSSRLHQMSLSQGLLHGSSPAGEEPLPAFHKSHQSQNGVHLLCEDAQPRPGYGEWGGGGPAAAGAGGTSTLLPGEGQTELLPCRSPETTVRWSLLLSWRRPSCWGSPAPYAQTETQKGWVRPTTFSSEHLVLLHTREPNHTCYKRQFYILERMYAFRNIFKASP